MKVVTKSTGKSSEELFMLLTGARASPMLRNGEARGDVILDGGYVEIKFTASDGAKNVRATRYIPVVVHTPHSWHVVPPNEVVALVGLRRRGMNCEVGFENGRLYLHEIVRFACPAQGLRSAVHDAVVEGERWPALKAEMWRLNESLRRLAQETRSRVSLIVLEGPVP